MTTSQRGVWRTFETCNQGPSPVWRMQADDSVLNEEEERLLDRLMASQLAQRWCPLRDLGLVSLHRLRRAPPAAHRGVAVGACVCMVLTKEAEGSVALSRQLLEMHMIEQRLKPEAGREVTR